MDFSNKLFFWKKNSVFNRGLSFILNKLKTFFFFVDESNGYKITWSKLKIAMECEFLLVREIFKNLKDIRCVFVPTKVFFWIPSSAFQFWISELIAINCIQSSSISIEQLQNFQQPHVCFHSIRIQIMMEYRFKIDFVIILCSKCRWNRK